MKSDPKNTGQGIKPQTYEQRELLTPGHMACPGCGVAMAMRMALKALGPETVVVMPTSCTTFSTGPFPYTALRVPLMHTAFATTAACASGVRAALDLRGKSGVQVVGWADADNAFGAGLAQLARAARDDLNMIFVCCNSAPDEASGTWDIADMMASHGIPYFASTTAALPHDLMDKFEKARSKEGFRFLHVLASCPGKWGIEPRTSVEVMRELALSGAFPIYEVEGGRVTLNIRPRRVPERMKRLMRADEEGEL